MRSSRAARARVPRKTREDSAIYERWWSVVGAVIWRGDDVEVRMAALGWQHRLPQVYRMRHAGVQDAERSRWGARGGAGSAGSAGSTSQ